MTKRQASPTLYRTATLQVVRAADGKSDPEITVALSSDTPIERSDWWGERWIEILEHSKDAIDFTRAKQGLPLLLNHNTDQQVGRIENLKAGDDGVLRGSVRFSKSAVGQEVLQDVLDGIRVETSVGYTIQDRKEEQEKGKILTIRATRWMPMEGSLVPVPADHTVGVGRAAESQAPVPIAQEQRTMEPTSPPAPASAPVVTVAADAGAVERTRVSELRALQRSHKVSDAKFDEWHSKGTPVEAATREVLAGYESTVRPGFMPAADGPAVSTEDLERGHYSLSRALLAQVDSKTNGADPLKIAPFEMEVHNALRERRDKSGEKNFSRGGIIIPMNMWVKPAAAQAAREQIYFQRGAHEVATASKGGELKFTEPGPFIELLRNRIFTRVLGARFLAGLNGDLQFPRQTGTHTVAWVGESPTADASESNLTLDNLNLAPKLATATTSYTRKLLAQAVVDIDNLIRDDFIQVFAIEADRVGLNGLGTSNEPRGILNTVGIGSVAGGTNGLAPTYDHQVDLEKEVAIDNADLGNLAYLTNPKVRAALKKVAQISASTGIPVWYQGDVNGYRAEATNQVPSNLTKGTSTTICSAIIFGNWQELIFGQWGDMEVVVDPYTQARRANILITPYLMIDVGVRHPVSFAAMKDALAS
jgi:HK97 family phage major capsid protein